MPDTIFALATPPGEGGIAVVRVSGANALSVLRGAFRPLVRGGFEPRRVYVGRIADADGGTIDETIVFYMPAPRSYTREDVVEIQCHGGMETVRAVLARVGQLGARPAEPGEFTRRAFENGRIDLVEAEAVMSLISARSAAAARSAARQLTGGASARIRGLRDELLSILSEIEASDDFPEEIEEAPLRATLLARALRVESNLRRVADEKGAHFLRDGVSIALTGRPNVGKSSLLNALTGSDRAIVDDLPGTTRDVLTERVTASGRLLVFSDTAGQRQAESRVESIGVQRAREAEDQADLVLLVLSLSEPLFPEDREILARADDRYLVVENKLDLPPVRSPLPGAFLVSARDGSGIDRLLAAVVERAGIDAADEDALTVPRQLELAGRAASDCGRAAEALRDFTPLDIAAIPLWDAARALGEITGEEVGASVIEQIFQRFCVGK